jgi:hypothetical protein
LDRFRTTLDQPDRSYLDDFAVSPPFEATHQHLIINELRNLIYTSALAPTRLE